MTISIDTKPAQQGFRERKRRLKQIVNNKQPFDTFGGDPLAEFHLAKRNLAEVALRPPLKRSTHG